MPSTISQPVAASLTPAAIFLVVTVNDGPQHEATVRALCGDLAALLRAVGFRDLDGRLSCVMAFGSDAWDRLFGAPSRRNSIRSEIRGQHHALATPGDILSYPFHAHGSVLRAGGPDHGAAGAPSPRPTGARLSTSTTALWGSSTAWRTRRPGRVDATVIGEEDSAFAGGSYVIVQKYLHDLKGWNAVPVAQQEGFIGRTKLSDIELDDAVKPSFAHNALTTIEENGEELEIVRANMPFGEVGKGEFGTYFCGYARSPHRIEQMLENVFVGKPLRQL